MRVEQEKIPFQYIQKLFSKLSPESISKRTSIIYDIDHKIFKTIVMGKKYHIHYPSGNVWDENGDSVTSYVLKTIFLRYLVNGKGTLLTGNYITYREITDGNIYYTNFYNRTILRLAKIYDNNHNIFQDNISNINVKMHNNGDFAFSFDFLKNIRFMFVLYKGDEEFPSSANILFDSNIEDYFNAEDLAVVVDVAIEYFANEGKIPKSLGMYSF
ncbi:MAG: DUF3786 domain-containing protein [Eubacteriaceae bacterium]